MSVPGSSNRVSLIFAEGRILRIGSRHRLPKAGHLLIQDVRREDQGLYRCIVQGAQGEVFTRDVYVHVVGEFCIKAVRSRSRLK